MPERPERTEIEREAARRERELRRATAGLPPAAAERPRAAAERPRAAAERPRAAAKPPRAAAKRPRAAAKRPRAAAKRARAPRPGTPRRTGPALFVRRALAVFALALGLVVVWFLVELFQPLHGSGHDSVVVHVPQDASAGEVGDLLARDGVISSSFFFDLRATLAGDRGKLYAGTYRLPLGTSYGNALAILTTPPPARPVTYVTITGGLARSQINALLRSQHVPGNYLVATRRSPLLDPAQYGAPRSTPTLEGFLFPDTYQVYEPLRISELVDDQLRTFKQEFATVNTAFARSRHLTSYDVLIIASIIQAEAATSHDFPLVASVIYNRLAAGMSLGSDATTRYATGNYTRPLTDSQISSPSPWNTRDRPGLPPTPINSPGLATLEAAAHPASTNYLYFIVKPCGDGALEYATNYQTFLVQDAAYQAASAKRGGNSPEFCSKKHRG